ncbi:hypothetical protein I4I73_21900 [Pseudonocardia sp. KRD-184]|nr:hypothetical protein [Pseudonocardia oceani]MBW0098644.1 hypothetical protein [Pseudonocardia oceani]MBW0124944.1 hypothetical protein [Pseudonocardia oceani]
MEMWMLLTVLVLIALAAPRYGVDSRRLPPGELPPPRRRATPRGDLVRLARAARQVFQSQVPRAKTASVCPPSSRCSAL